MPLKSQQASAFDSQLTTGAQPCEDTCTELRQRWNVSHCVVKHPIRTEMKACGRSRKCFGSYRLVSSVDADEEEEFCHKEADAQVLVNRVAVTLQPTEEAEGEDADQKADQ